MAHSIWSRGDLDQQYFSGGRAGRQIRVERQHCQPSPLSAFPNSESIKYAN
ncbi:hypothetical protein [Moorena producens]|uniref:hypothetical protein n=1 Tax=Moorena producens TaxID=1155739 RepID=UPI001E3E4F63|nr:hypothetical protein [Moorena producens]